MGKRAELRGTAAIIFVRTAKPIDKYFSGRVAYVRRAYSVADTSLFTYHIHEVTGMWLGSIIDVYQPLAQIKAFRLARELGFTQVLWVH